MRSSDSNMDGFQVTSSSGEPTHGGCADDSQHKSAHSGLDDTVRYAGLEMSRLLDIIRLEDLGVSEVDDVFWQSDESDQDSQEYVTSSYINTTALTHSMTGKDFGDNGSTTSADIDSANDDDSASQTSSQACVSPDTGEEYVLPIDFIMAELTLSAIDIGYGENGSTTSAETASDDDEDTVSTCTDFDSEDDESAVETSNKASITSGTGGEVEETRSCLEKPPTSLHGFSAPLSLDEGVSDPTAAKGAWYDFITLPGTRSGMRTVRPGRAESRYHNWWLKYPASKVLSVGQLDFFRFNQMDVLKTAQLKGLELDDLGMDAAGKLYYANSEALDDDKRGPSSVNNHRITVHDLYVGEDCMIRLYDESAARVGNLPFRYAWEQDWEQDYSTPNHA